MDSERWRQIDGLLQAALQRPPAERANFLKNACAGDEALETEVRSRMEPPEMAQSGLAGQTISHYKIVEKLGAGGMGVVYKAFDTKLDRMVALKFLPPHLRDNQELKRRLSEEARAASTLDHANIVVIYEIDETPGGDLFIAMAYHDGATLTERIKASAKTAAGMPVSEALQVARQVASGLAKAHERGIFHRDIKPSNVIVAKDGVARIIDFGLAKSTDATATFDGTTKGTPVYMSPEQASGKAVDFRTDLWSLGAVLYEMLAGRPPFSGETHLQVMRAIVSDTPLKLSGIRPDVPPEVEAIVSRSLEKDIAKRYQSAADMARDLSAALAALEAPARKQAALRAVYAVPVLILILLAAAASIWFYQRSEKRHWAREQAIPEIARLTSEGKPVTAFLLAQKARNYLADDSQFAQTIDNLAHTVTVNSSPSGATVEIKDYLSPGDPWLPLGTTPLKNVQIPTGYLRWRISKAGVGEMFAAPITQDIRGQRPEFQFPLDAAAAAPKGMVAVPAVQFNDLLFGLGMLGPYDLPAFSIDRYEVTNREYQEFVDGGGYQKREYWKEKFIRDGHELSWEQAMDLFRDTTGRVGPSTWVAGHYADGQQDYPVGGVSWYEASAYAAFAGKSLPVIAQWYAAAPGSISRYIMQLSNFQSALAPAGKFPGLGQWGTYDMAGNVAEWCRNEAGGGTRYILGGAWNTSGAEYFEPANLPPFDRSANGGFRCVRNTAALPAEAVAETPLKIRDFSKVKPATDEVFRIYQGMYTYDRTLPLNARQETAEQDSTDWRKEKIEFDAAYGRERMAAFLFLPAKVRPPYQTVVFFPSARVLFSTSSKTLGDMNFVDYVIQSGRAVMYPIYKGTYERLDPNASQTPAATRDLLIEQSKDFQRSIDYLETRPDIDRNRIGYLGVSMGASWGVILAAVEPRLKAVVLLDGGFVDGNPLPGSDQVDFAPRLKAPVIMIGGRFDWFSLGRESMFRMFATPAADKKFISLNSGHDVAEQRPELVREVVAFLDKYFGRVN